MKTIRTSIIPERQSFARVGRNDEIDFKAICIFVCTGFFLESDTFRKNIVVLQPYTEYDVNEDSLITKSNRYWNWHYSPREISLKQAVEEFAQLFEKISSDKLRGKKIILPLSGGLDSRTQAAALPDDYSISSYSYKFANSFDETKYGKEIARLKSFPFQEFEIEEGYLWKVIERLAEINGCYADFTHPRQMAVIDSIKNLGEIFYLGHWGDVLFDDTGINDDADFDDIVCFLKKKIVKKGGQELAESLWESWGISGNFNDYFTERVSGLLNEMKIENANSRVRAFKSTYWAPRWTAANLNVFGDFHEMSLPYFSDEMCRFICTIPEQHLAGRQIQIEYIKMKSPELAMIPWQNYDPLNLYDYKKFGSKKMIPGRIIRKGKRMFNENVLGKKSTTRNWEIQFIGEDNDRQLKQRLFESKQLQEFIPDEVVRKFYEKFRKDEVYYSHPVSMLLTLSLFCEREIRTVN